MTQESGRKNRNFKFGKKSKEKLLGVHPDLVLVCNEAIKISPIDFAIVQGVRTQEYQDMLYAQGRTAPGKKVTWTRNSRHIGGFAIDFAAVVDSKISWDERHYPVIADAFKEAARRVSVPIEWGGDWKSKKDWGHIELPSSKYPK